MIEGLELTKPGATVEVAGVIVSADTVTAQIRSGVLDLDVLPARELTVVLQLAEIARRRDEAVVTRVVEAAERMCRYTADGHRGVRGWVKASARWSNHQARVHADVGRLDPTA